MSATLQERLQACRERMEAKWKSLPEDDHDGRFHVSLNCHELRFFMDDVVKIEARLEKLEAEV